MENASYGKYMAMMAENKKLTVLIGAAICAERTAFVKAVVRIAEIHETN